MLATTRRLVRLLVLLGLPVVSLGCCLCDLGKWSGAMCFPHPMKAERWVGLGKQCADIVTDIIDIPGDAACGAAKAPFERKCCDATFQFDDFEQPAPPTDPPGEAEPDGIHPKCNICFNGQYPGNPYTITSITGVEGNPTCQDLWRMGRKKHIEPAMCYPIQLFMQKPCGCDKPPGPGGPPDEGGDEPTTPSPTRAPVTRAPIGVPMMRKRPLDLDKDNLKLYGGRVRGSTNSRRGLKGESSEEQPIHPLLQPIENSIA